LHTPDEVLCCLNGHTAGTTMFILETTVSIHNFVTVFIKLITITAFSSEMLGSSVVDTTGGTYYLHLHGKNAGRKLL